MTAITEERTEEATETLSAAAETRPGTASLPAPRESGGTAAPCTRVSGIVDLTDGRGYLRTAGYRRSGGDIPLTASQVRQYGLRKGDQIDAAVTGDRTGAASGGAAGKGAANGQRPRQAGRVDVTAINGQPPDEARERRHFDDLTPLYPNQRFRLEDGDPSPAARIIDLVSPIGRASAASSSPRPRPARPPS